MAVRAELARRMARRHERNQRLAGQSRQRARVYDEDVGLVRQILAAEPVRGDLVE